MIMVFINHHQQPNLQLDQKICSNSERTREAVSCSDAQAAFENDFISIASLDDDVDPSGAKLEQKPWLYVSFMMKALPFQSEVGKQGGHPLGAYSLKNTRFCHDHHGELTNGWGYVVQIDATISEVKLAQRWYWKLQKLDCE